MNAENNYWKTAAQDFIEQQVVTTRFYEDQDETLVSMAGIAYKTPAGGTMCLLNPNDGNVSVLISAANDGMMVNYHCFTGLFAARVYRCLDKPWETFRLHMNVYRGSFRREENYGDLLLEQSSGNNTTRISIEHFGPQVVPQWIILQAIEKNDLESLIEKCPIRLTPDPKLYQINLEVYPHPGLIPARDQELAVCVMQSRPQRKSYVI